MTPEEILKKNGTFEIDNFNIGILHEDAIKSMKEWGDQRFIEGRDKGLEYSLNHFYDDVNPTISGKTSNELHP